MHDSVFSMGFSGIFGILLIILAITFGNAAGVGGAGIIVPVLLIVFPFEILEASALSNSMIFLAFALRYYFNFKERHPYKNKPLIDYDTASLMLPASLLGTKFGVIIHDTFPHPILMILLSVTLLYLAYRSYLQGNNLSRIEEMKKIHPGPAEPMISMSTMAKDPDILLEGKAPESVKARLKEIEQEEAKNYPLKKAVLILGLLGFLTISMVVEGAKGLPSLFGIEICSTGYWTSVILFIIICAIVTLINARDVNALTREKQELGYKIDSEDVIWSWGKIIEYAAYGFFAGVLSAIFGIGGGMILAPVLVQLGMIPQVVSATGGLFVLFTTAASSLILTYEGYLIVSYGILFGVISIGSSLLSIYMITGIVKRFGKPSIIVYIMAVVVFVSGATISAVGFYQDYQKYGTLLSGKLWSFRNYCHRD